jgi:drug/metabolite transporter (DMT)-like permease
MSDLNLYVTAVLIWGSTWLAIKFQLGVVPPAVSVVWRFALSAFLLLAYAMWKRLPLRFAPGQHLWLGLEGLAMFGINYVWVYLAEGYLTSGLVAVVFSLMVILNTILMRLFYGAPIRTSDALGAVIGIGGVVLVFWPEVARFSASGEQELGLAYAFGATLVASLGNMVAVRNQRKGLGLVQVHGWAMLYGAIAVALYAAFIGDPFVFDWSAPYVASLLYLALFGSVLAFGAYVTLMGRIGPGRAAYSAIAIPVVALLLSTLFERLQWQMTMVAGIALCLLGNLLVLSRKQGVARVNDQA